MSRNNKATAQHHADDHDGNEGHRGSVSSEFENNLGVFIESDTCHAGEIYFRTTEVLADLVGVKLNGKDMRALIKQQIETDEAVAVPPSESTDSKSEESRYKKLLDEFLKEKRKYTDEAKVFIIILGKCSQELRTNVELSSQDSTLEASYYEVVGLLENTEDTQHPCVELKCLDATIQGQNETVGNYDERLVQPLTTVFEEQCIREEE